MWSIAGRAVRVASPARPGGSSLSSGRDAVDRAVERSRRARAATTTRCRLPLVAAGEPTRTVPMRQMPSSSTVNPASAHASGSSPTMSRSMVASTTGLSREPDRHPRRRTLAVPPLRSRRATVLRPSSLARPCMVGLIALVALLVATAGPAAACGGLVGENGTIQLVAHDDARRVPRRRRALRDVVRVHRRRARRSARSSRCPACRRKVERGGDWTLQRLEREVAPPSASVALRRPAKAPARSRREVILQTKIDALDITILKGGGNAVGKWAVDHGFLLTPDAPECSTSTRGAARSSWPRASTRRARQQLGQNTGDGTPIMLTIPTTEPWVPLRILASASTSAAGRQRRRVPAHRRPAEAARRRTRA